MSDSRSSRFPTSDGTKLFPAFSVAAATRDNRSVVSVRGDIDLATAPGLAEFVIRLTDAHPLSVTLDFAGVTFLDCSGISALVSIRKACNRKGIEVFLDSVPSHALRVLELTRIDSMVKHASFV